MDDRAFMDEILANHFRAVTEEMSSIVLRAAHTTFVKETQDYAAALITPEGEVYAYPHATGVTALCGIPMQDGVAAFDDWAEGDIAIANDPYRTHGMVMHLPDLYLLKPIFVQQELVCFAWAFLHCSDIGGTVPGSTDMRSYEIFQEGLQLRPTKLYARGVKNEDVWNILSDNSRIPSLNQGDIEALIAALRRGESRVHAMIDKYGLEDFRKSMYGTLDRTASRSRAFLSSLPHGSYEFTDYLDSDYNFEVPVRISVKMTIEESGSVSLDFTKSDPQVRAALNLPTGSQAHHPFLSLALMNLVVTNTEGIHLILPKSSIVNSSYPAAVGMRFVTAMRVHDAVLGALALAGVPAPAAGAGQIAVTLVSTTDLSQSIEVAVANPIQGGTGGGPAADGVNGIDYPVAFLRNVPTEVLESEMPVLVHRFGLIQDSEGAGEWRGGFGVEYELSVDHLESTIVMRGKERYSYTPWGVNGGLAGSLGSTQLSDGGKFEDISKQSYLRPDPQTVLRISGAGGGGYGNPLDRNAELVLRDFQDGLISSERMSSVYGVAVDGGRVDESATEARRAEIAATASPSRMFDFGAARNEWDLRFGEGLSRLGLWISSLPHALRPYARETALRELTREELPGWDSEVVDPVIARIEMQLRERGFIEPPDGQQ